MDEQQQTSSLYNRSMAWLSQLVTNPDARNRRGRLIVASTIIFLAASGVRLIHWQDYQLSINAEQSSLAKRYQQQAQRMLDGGGILYPTGFREHSSIQLLLHPPGYSIFIATIFGLFGHSDSNLVRAQIICDSLAAVLVFAIAVHVLPLGVSGIAGLLVACSPHLAHHSLMLMPESLTVLPILVAVFLLIRATRQPRLVPFIIGGAMIGLSCWLRSNTLLLAPFCAAAILLLFERRRRLKYALTFLFATIVVMSPITIRNCVVYGHFIPLSLGSGITMIEGIADYDKENRFGMPATDDDAMQKDIEWRNRPDYATLWRPEGIERERYRFARGLEVIRNNPVWFAGVMIRRASAMLRYNDSRSLGWPADTAIAPLVSSEPSFGHQVVIPAESVWSSPASDLLARGQVLSPLTECALTEDRETLTVAGDDSSFGNQFSSAPIGVRQSTDYVLRVAIRLVDGDMAGKVTSADKRITLASGIPLPPETEPRRKIEVETRIPEPNKAGEYTSEERSSSIEDNQLILLPFATGSRSEVLFVVSNDGSSVRPKAEIGEAELFELGQTPHQWSRFVRPAVRGIERNVYQTSRMLSLIGIGIILLAAARRWRVLVVLLTVPAYYLLVQSALHTEYRYILAIHYLLFIVAAVTVYFACTLIALGVHRVACTFVALTGRVMTQHGGRHGPED